MDSLENEMKEIAEKQKERNENLDKQFSAYDGSHRGLTELIKKNMPDPESYEHVKTTFVDKGDYLIVETKFRGKNGFGGYVFQNVRAKVDLDGNVLEVISQN